MQLRIAQGQFDKQNLGVVDNNLPDNYFMILYKLGEGLTKLSAPSSILSDGTAVLTAVFNLDSQYEISQVEVVMNEKILNTSQYQLNNAGTIVTLIVPNVDGIVDIKIATKTSSLEIYTIYIDLDNEDPYECCSYKEDSAGNSINDWNKIFGFYPVVLKDGIETILLNPLDFSTDIDGNKINFTDDLGDVMIAFPRRGLNITRNDNIIEISFCTSTANENFKYYAHTKGTAPVDTFYLGAYEGWIDGSGKLRSLKNKYPTVNKSIAEFRRAAQSNGDGYEQMSFYQTLYLQAMFVMMYKTLDAQSALGWGYVGIWDEMQLTGKTDQRIGSMHWGTQVTQLEFMKFAGIENLWGHVWKWVDGLVTDQSRNYLTTTSNFNDAGLNYPYTSLSGLSEETNGYMSDCVGTTEGGFLMTENRGASNKYFSDYCYNGDLRVAIFGGRLQDVEAAGLFRFSLYFKSGETNSQIGARLQKL